MGTKSLLDVYIGYITHLIRAPAIATALFFLLQPIYNASYHAGSQYMTDRFFVFLLLYLVHILTYWTINTFFFICDQYSYLQQYKLPRKNYQIPSKELILKTVKGAIIGQLVVSTLGLYCVVVPVWQTRDPLMIYHSDAISNNKLYYILLIYSKFVFSDVCNSWLFYAAHRLLHHELFY